MIYIQNNVDLNYKIKSNKKLEKVVTSSKDKYPYNTVNKNIIREVDENRFTNTNTNTNDNVYKLKKHYGYGLCFNQTSFRTQNKLFSLDSELDFTKELILEQIKKVLRLLKLLIVKIDKIIYYNYLLLSLMKIYWNFLKEFKMLKRNRRKSQL